MKNYFSLLAVLILIALAACTNQTETKNVNDTTVIESPDGAGTGTALTDSTYNQKDSAILRSDTTRMTN